MRILKLDLRDHGVVELQKHPNYFNVVKGDIQFSNGYILNIQTIDMFKESLDMNTSGNGFFDLTIVDKSGQKLYLEEDTIDEDVDSFNYQVNEGEWKDLSYESVVQKCELIKNLKSIGG
jgi:hypothetical protein